MRKLFATLWLGLLSFVVQPAQAEITSIGDAINKAGFQRTLTQAMITNYSLILLEVHVSQHQRMLNEEAEQFENTLKDLQAYAPAADVKDAFDQVERLWGPFKQQITAAPQMGSLKALYADADELLKASHAAVRKLAGLTSEKEGRLTNIAGRQRTLVERMAALYMLEALGYEEEPYITDLANATMEFKLAETELEGAEQNTPEIRAFLKDVKTQFSLFEFSVTKESETYFPFVVSEASEKILEDMNNVVALYAAMHK